jgi:putative metalloprotease
MHNNMKKIVIICLFALLLQSCGSLNMGALSSASEKALQALMISDQDIEQYVGEYIRQLDSENTIAGANDPYAVRLNRIAGAINNQNGINIKVYKTNDVNAFAVADGSVRIFSGLMDIMSDEEVLGVIGHEIGHVKLTHTKNAFKNALLTSAARDVVGSVGGLGSTLSASILGDIAEALSSSRFSQRQEFEADDFGYEFLKAAGLNPWAMALSFGKLKQMEEQAGGNASGAILQLFSTHPDLETRIRRMSERATQDGFRRP